MADVWQLYKSLKLYILSNFALLKNPRLPLHYDDPLKRVQNVVFAVEHQGGVEICSSFTVHLLLFFWVGFRWDDNQGPEMGGMAIKNLKWVGWPSRT